MNDKAFLASIVIPYHGNSRDVKRLLDTIPDHPNLEIILVNDIHESKPLFHSPFSLSTLRELTTAPPARWAGASRNTGLYASKGKYILFADSDDTLIKERVTELLEILKKCPSFCYAICPVTSILNTTGETGHRHLKYTSIVNSYASNKSKLKLLRHYVPWGKVYTRSFLIDNNILFEEVIASNDVLFSIKCLIFAKQIPLIDSLFYKVTESTASLTRTMTKEIVQARFLESCKYNDFLRANGYQDYLGAMSGVLFNIVKGYPLFFPYAFAVCVLRRYPVFYSFSHLKKIANREFFGKA